FFAHILATVTFNIRVDYMSIGFLVADLVMLAIEISCFRKIKQIVICKPKIVFNIPCQFFAHTLATVTFNICVDYMSIGFLVANLVMLAIEISCFRKIKQIVICKPKIVFNIPCQFFAHILATVMLNIRVDCMSIGLLVADLVMLVIEISCFRKIKQTVICKPKIVLNIPCQFFAHTLATVMLNIRVDCMSVGLLVVNLVMLVIEISCF